MSENTVNILTSVKFYIKAYFNIIYIDIFYHLNINVSISFCKLMMNKVTAVILFCNYNFIRGGKFTVQGVPDRYFQKFAQKVISCKSKKPPIPHLSDTYGFLIELELSVTSVFFLEYSLFLIHCLICPLEH